MCMHVFFKCRVHLPSNLLFDCFCPCTTLSFTFLSLFLSFLCLSEVLRIKYLRRGTEVDTLKTYFVPYLITGKQNPQYHLGMCLLQENKWGPER